MIVDEHSVPRSKKPPIFCKFQTLMHSQALTSECDNERTCQQLAATGSNYYTINISQDNGNIPLTPFSRH